MLEQYCKYFNNIVNLVTILKMSSQYDKYCNNNVNIVTSL